MEVLRSLPDWKSHVVRAVVDLKKKVKRKRGPRVQNTRIKKRRVREKSEYNAMLEERRQMALQELQDCPTPELEQAAFELETNTIINEQMCSLVLQECGHERALSTGMRLHKHMQNLGYDHQTFLGNHLVQMYGKCGRVDLAYKAFTRIRHRDTRTWTAMMNVYVAKGYVESARRVFNVTPRENFVSWNTMIAAYAQFGHIEAAEHLFFWMVKKTIVTYTTMVRGYNLIGDYRRAIETLELMDLEGFQADKVAVSRGLASYAGLGNLHEGETFVRSVSSAADTFLLRGTVQVNALVNMYSKCGSLQDAARVCMRAPERDLLLWSSLLEAYARGGYLKEAKAMFDEVGVHDVCSWTAMIIGYTLGGHPELALELVPEMDIDGVGCPDWETWIAVIEACGLGGSSNFARYIQKEIVAQGLNSRLDIANAMLGMYVQLGEYKACMSLFVKMKRHSVCSWAWFIAGNAGISSRRCTKAFWSMMHIGVRPNSDCIGHLLQGFLRDKLVTEAIECFARLERDYDMKPAAEHYMKLIEILVQCGKMDLAQDLLLELPPNPM